MNTERSGATAARMGVLSEIAARLRDILPEQYIAPEQRHQETDHVVGTASESLKKLFTLRRVLWNESQAVIKENLYFINGLKPTLSDTERLGRIMSEVHAAKSLYKVVDSIVWLEIKRQHPNLPDNRTIGISSDWSVFWRGAAKCDECGQYHDDDSMSVGGLMVVNIGGFHSDH